MQWISGARATASQTIEEPGQPQPRRSGESAPLSVVQRDQLGQLKSWGQFVCKSTLSTRRPRRLPRHRRHVAGVARIAVPGVESFEVAETRRPDRASLGICGRGYGDRSGWGGPCFVGNSCPWPTRRPGAATETGRKARGSWCTVAGVYPEHNEGQSDAVTRVRLTAGDAVRSRPPADWRRVGEHRHPHGGLAEECQHHEDSFDTDRQRYVLPEDRVRASTVGSSRGYDADRRS